MTEKAYDYLNRDRLRYIDMLETLDRGIAELIYADEEGVLLYNIPGKTYMVSTESESFLHIMCGLVSDPELILVHQPQFVPLLQEKYGFKTRMECFQCAYTLSKKLDVTAGEGIELRELTMAELRFVADNYENSSDEAYIAERIGAGMIGAFCNGVPAGFIGTHSEGSMGILHVLPAYRRLGIAYLLESAMINRMADMGQTPYAQIVTTNNASIRLQEKLGMVFSDKTVIWLFDK
ncbi:MAG: GNAT family N-acetyltransferase [Clostridiales bacterium]|jgi:ribosomal protein S18 acetylase RimI-like enzyme|nr:GNAT family N-acetyltransferase [Clostridiales bacterium]